MKILFISDEDQQYGAARSMFELVTTLKNKYNIEPIVATCNYGVINENLKIQNINNFVLNHRPFMVRVGSTKFKKLARKILMPIISWNYVMKNKKAVDNIESYISINDIDLIYTNVNRIDLGAILAKKYNKPHIWHIREFGDIDYPLVSLRKDYISFMNQHTNYFIAISKAVQKSWIKKGLDTPKFRLIYNGVSEHNLLPVIKDNSIIKILFTGSISETKQQIQLINACALLSEEIKSKIQIHFYGSGTKGYVRYLNGIIKKNKLDNIVKFKGYSENISKKIVEYDLGVICSRAEGFGRVTAEYMMGGLPVIASNTGANPELINDGINGYLYEYNNVQDLAKKIEVIVFNKELIKSMGQQGKKIAIENFTKEKNAENIYKVIMEVIEGTEK